MEKVRLTQLNDRDSGTASVLAHPSASIFDIGEFNASVGANYRAVPETHLNGAAFDQLDAQAQLLLDQALLGNETVQIWHSIKGYEEVPLKQLAGGHVVRATNPIPPPIGYVHERQAIDEAVSTFTERRIQQRLDETLEIPPLPEAARQIVALHADPNYDLSDLVQIVETDPAIAARIMSWASSAYYSADPPPKSIDDAIMRVLGFDLVMNLALGLLLAGTLRLPESHVAGAPPVWMQAVFRAAAMEGLARKLPAKVAVTPGTAYLTGLLSNFGTLVLGHVFPPQYRAICRLKEANPHLPTVVLDEYVLNLSREVIGATLLEQWDLPPEVTLPIRHRFTENYSGDCAPNVLLLQAASDLLGDHLIAEPQAVTESQLSELGIDTPELEAVSQLLSESQAEIEGFARAVA